MPDECVKQEIIGHNTYGTTAWRKHQSLNVKIFNLHFLFCVHILFVLFDPFVLVNLEKVKKKKKGRLCFAQAKRKGSYLLISELCYMIS